MLAKAAAAFDLPAYAKGHERQVKEVASFLRVGKTADARLQWTGLIEKLASAGVAIDPNALVQHVLRESYLQTTEDLRSYAEKVKYFNTCKKLIREYLAKLRASDKSMRSFSVRTPKLRDSFVPGASPVTAIIARTLPDAAALENEIKKWEEKLNTIGDDAQLANVDLQNILQKQQQTLQMMSNISKMLYDTAQSVIRKMGG
jgi:hypothetical protein